MDDKARPVVPPLENFGIPEDINIDALLQGMELSDDDKKELEDEETLRESIIHGGLKNDPFSYFVATINMSDDGKQGIGAPKYRRLLLAMLLRRICPSLVFCQEPPGVFGSGWREERWGLVERASVDPQRFRCIKNGKEAAVFWDTTRFERIDTSIMTSDPSVINIRDDLQDKGLLVDNLLSRVAMVKLRRLPKEDEEGAAAVCNAEAGNEKVSTLLAVSYHGQRNISEPTRKEICSALITFVREVAGDMPYVVGGDFNFNTEVFNKNKVIVHSFEPTSRSAEKEAKSTSFIPNKDNFMYDHRQGLEMTEVRPIDLKSEVAQDGEQKLDHDPIVGVLTFGKKMPILNLVKKFDAVVNH